MTDKKTTLWPLISVSFSPAKAEDLGSIPGLERSPGEGRGYPLHYSGLENSMEFMGSQRVKTLSDFHFTSLYFSK